MNNEILKNLDIDKVKEFNGKVEEKGKRGWQCLTTTEDANLAKLNESQREKFFEVLIAYINSYQKDIETLALKLTTFS